jgi:CheY-like chemotaxis protein
MAGTEITAKTVIIASESESVRDGFQASLESAGHRGLAVSSAAELMTIVRDDTPPAHLAVLDLRLRGADGVGLVRAIRELDGGRLPILVFSGTITSAKEVRELEGLGVVGYVNEHSAPQHILPSLAPHLFPDSFNRRTSPRAVIGLPVQYHAGETIAAAVALNLGHGGLAIRTTSPFELKALITVRFRIPGSTRDIEAGGRVAWSDHRVGIGVQFEITDAAGQQLIDNFVVAHCFSNRKT